MTTMVKCRTCGNKFERSGGFVRCENCRVAPMTAEEIRARIDATEPTQTMRLRVFAALKACGALR